MKEKPYILIVDDDPNISRLVALYLEKEGYEVRPADRGDDAVNEFTRLPPDLMVLDVMLPGMDGYQVLKSVRKSSAIPVIMLTARDETFDKVLGLELGADDYMTKLSFPGLTVSIAEYAVYYEGKRLDMPPKELEVLYFLAGSPNQVFTREQLLKQGWGFDFFGDSRTVDVHIKRLREKLTGSEKYGWSIHTVRGVGYKFEMN